MLEAKGSTIRKVKAINIYILIMRIFLTATLETQKLIFKDQNCSVTVFSSIAIIT